MTLMVNICKAGLYGAVGAFMFLAVLATAGIVTLGLVGLLGQ